MGTVDIPHNQTVAWSPAAAHSSNNPLVIHYCRRPLVPELHRSLPGSSSSTVKKLSGFRGAKQRHLDPARLLGVRSIRPIMIYRFPYMIPAIRLV